MSLASPGTVEPVPALYGEGPDPVRVEDFDPPPRDAVGWTRLVPSADSRLAYVDSVDGDDATGRVHAPSDAGIGADPRAPVGAVRPYRTLSAAAAQLREDAPDWLLLKAGGVWEEPLTLRRGRSPKARAVCTAYGKGPRPELRTGRKQGIAAAHAVNVVVDGIAFWAHTRDTEGPFFVDFAGASGFNFSTRKEASRQVRDVLIEDCSFRAYGGNVLTGGVTPITRFILRRSLVLGSYSVKGHSQGLYHFGTPGSTVPTVLLEENVFDHNGWRTRAGSGDPNGQATWFNHNTYFTNGRHVLMRRNLFLRSSSIGGKWSAVGVKSPRHATEAIVVEDNTYVEGEIGISIGGNDKGPGRFRDVRIRDNVFCDLGRARPTNRSLAWGIDVQDWTGGAISRNLIVHQRSGIDNAYALKVGGGSTGIRIDGNVFARLDAGIPLVLLGGGTNGIVAHFADNVVQGDSSAALVRLDASRRYVFGGRNRYASAAGSPAFVVADVRTDLSGWIDRAGDRLASADPPSFPDGARDIAGYMAFLGLGSTFEDFVASVRAQSRANWNPALAAGPLNNWLRAGFGLRPVP